MIGFWSIAILLVGIAVLFVVLPLLRGSRRPPSVAQSELNISVHRDRLDELEADHRSGNLSARQYAEARDELKRNLLDDVPAQSTARAAKVDSKDKVIAIALACAIPIVSVLLYARVGNREALAPAAVALAPTQPYTPEQVEELVDRLAAQLQKTPQDAQGWMLLGRAYYSMRRYGDAKLAFAKAAELTPNDAQTLVDYADALAIDSGQGLTGTPLELLRRALQIDPNHPKALTLAGSAAFDQQNYTQAVEHWSKLLRALPPDSEFSRDIAASIARAQQLAAVRGNRKPAAAATAQNKPQVAAAPAQSRETEKPEAMRAAVSGTVKLSERFAREVSATDTVFIFARAASKAGSKAPLAVVRKQVKDLPFAFSLSDADAVLPELKLSSHKQVIVGARVSKTGNGIAQSGDFEGISKPVKIGSRDLIVTIDQIAR